LKASRNAQATSQDLSNYQLARLQPIAIAERDAEAITVTNKINFVLGARSFPGNPYDGHTLESCLEQAEILSGTRAKEVFVDLGYRGVEVPNVTIYKARQKRGIDTRRLKRALKRRNAIEPIIGHLKNDGLLGRNYLKGELGDALHAILCGAGHNIRIILRRLRIFSPYFWRPLSRLWQILSTDQVLLSV